VMLLVCCHTLPLILPRVIRTTQIKAMPVSLMFPSHFLL
jgi:hypothetical protein